MSDLNKTSHKTIELSSVSFAITKRLILKKMTIPFLFLLAFALVVRENIFITWWVPTLLVVGIICISLFNLYYYKVFYYRLEDDYLLIKRHAINPREVILEYDRIKDIVIKRDALDRIFGLYQLKFKTDLSSPDAYKMAYIDGLDQVEVHELKLVIEHLCEKAFKKRKNVR